MKILMDNSIIKVWKFKNLDEESIVAFQFNVGEHSAPDYRGFKAGGRKYKKLAKMFRKLAKRLEK